MRALVLGLCLVACGGSAPEAQTAPKKSAAPVAVSPESPVPSRPLGTLKRTEVLAFVNSGFYNFLQRIEVEPSLDDGRFRGWLIVALRPAAFWQGVDLEPGDVVTSVNDRAIERETEAFDAFESLRTASALDVAYVRGGAKKRISFRIAD